MSLTEYLREKGIDKLEKRTWISDPSILIAPNIPPPMYGVVPREILGRKWWNETRQEAYQSTDYHCLACGIAKVLAPRGWLEGHEKYRVDYKAGRLTYMETLPLCNYCHSYIHDGRLKALWETGEINPHTYARVIQHGNRILASAGLSRPSLDEREKGLIRLRLAGHFAPWADWRLVLFGKEYPPKFKSEVQWRQVVRGQRRTKQN